MAETATGNDAQAMFEHARETGLYKTPFNVNQQYLATACNVEIEPHERCYDLAGKIYNVLLLRDWFSAFSETGRDRPLERIKNFRSTPLFHWQLRTNSFKADTTTA